MVDTNAGAGGGAERRARIPVEGGELEGTLALPGRARGIVLFAHGAGSSRLSPRNRFVAERLREAGVGTLLFDLLMEAEAQDRENVFDIGLLAGRLIQATDWVREDSAAGTLPIGYFGASTGAAAALVAAARIPDAIAAVVSRGGRPDLADDALARVRAPTLLIVGGLDTVVLRLNRRAYDRLHGERELVVVPGATHLFEEPGALEQAADHAARWFGTWLGAESGGRRVA